MGGQGHFFRSSEFEVLPCTKTMRYGPGALTVQFLEVFPVDTVCDGESALWSLPELLHYGPPPTTNIEG